MRYFINKVFRFFLIKSFAFFRVIEFRCLQFVKSVQYYFSVFVLREISIIITSEHGLGSKLNWMLEFLYFADRNNIRVNVEIGHMHCKQNVCGDIFKFKNDFISKRNFRISINRMDLILGLTQINNKLNLNKTRFLIDKYFEPIIFKSSLPNISRSLVLHLRGTDKINESTEFADNELLERIKDFVVSTKVNEIVVFSDDYRLQELVSNNFGSYTLKFPNYIDNKIPVIHHTQVTNCTDFFLVNKKALEDLLIMSKSKYILKTSSYLSDWSIILGSHDRVRLINRQLPEFNYFPSSEIATISS